MEGDAAAFLNEIKNIPGTTLPNKFDGPRPKSSTEMAYELVSGYTELLKTINTDTAVINVNSATIDEKSGSAQNRFYGRGPTGGPSNYVGRMSTSGLPSISNPVDYGKKSIAPNYQYQTGSAYTYSAPVAPVKKSMGGLIKMSAFPKMSSGGPVINTVPKYNSGGSVYASKSSSSSSVIIQSMPVYFAEAPGNPKEFFAKLKEAARQEGAKVSSGGKIAQ
jgi:hypothetical protein